jgi:DNA-binding NarL/FixJ family response regulator
MKKTLIIVEDEFIIQLFLKRLLSGYGFDVIGQTKSYEETLELLQTTRPDFMIVDIGIKGSQNGIDLMRELQNRQVNIPFLYMSGNSDQATYSEACNTHPLLFIFKPIIESDLRKKLFTLIENGQI